MLQVEHRKKDIGDLFDYLLFGFVGIQYVFLFTFPLFSNSNNDEWLIIKMFFVIVSCFVLVRLDLYSHVRVNDRRTD